MKGSGATGIRKKPTPAQGLVTPVHSASKYKAFSIAPAELEALLVEYPAVLDSAVIGLILNAAAS